MEILPDDLLIEIFSHNYTPVERKLAREFDRRLGPQIARLRNRRLLSRYQKKTEWETLRSIIRSADIDALKCWYYQDGIDLKYKTFLIQRKSITRLAVDNKVKSWLSSFALPKTFRIDRHRFDRFLVLLALTMMIYRGLSGAFSLITPV